MTVIVILLSVVVLLLVVAVLGLFAMMGELNARVDGRAESLPTTLVPLEEARVGSVIERWPAEFGGLQSDTTAVLILSSSCTSCARILSGETGELPPPGNLGIVLVAPGIEDGVQFLSQYPRADDYPHFIDAGGDWTRENIGIQSSPSVIQLEARRIVKASAFASAQALVTEIPK